MSEPIRLLRLGCIPAWQTQAIYHAVAETMTPDSPDTIILCQPASPYLCLGYHQSYDAVLDRAECERRRLPVFRRQVGGGATYLDSNQIFYQCVFHRRRVPAVFAAVFAQMLDAPVAALRRLGLNAALREVNEIEVDGKRIAGTGGGQIGEARIVVGNILFDFDYETMAQVWRAPWESFRELARAAMREHVVTLRQLIGRIEIETVERILIEEFARALQRPLHPDKLTQAEVEHARQVANRLSSPEYLALRSDVARVHAQPLKISAGVCIRAAEILLDDWRVQASFCVHGHTIEEARLESDPPRQWNKLELRLKGTAFQEWQNHLRALLPDHRLARHPHR